MNSQNQKNFRLPKETLKIFEFYTIINSGTQCAFREHLISTQ